MPKRPKQLGPLGLVVAILDHPRLSHAAPTDEPTRVLDVSVGGGDGAEIEPALHCQAANQGAALTMPRPLRNETR